MTSSAQTLITFFGGGVAGALLNAGLGWTTQRRQARSQVVKAIALTAGAWRESDEKYNVARAETLATALLAGVESGRIEAFLSVAGKLHQIQQRADRGIAVSFAQVNELEAEMYTELERIRLALWHPWQRAIARSAHRAVELSPMLRRARERRASSQNLAD